MSRTRRSRNLPLPVIDLFAGPGGLGEGFSSLRRGGKQAFRIQLSVEKDPFAHRTLRLRSFFRQFRNEKVPTDYFAAIRGDITIDELYRRFPDAARASDREALHGTLGGPDLPAEQLDARICAALQGHSAWVLIGGPPCQAYSIAGRSRNKGIKGYRLEEDSRHRLYEEYLRIVAHHWPAVFVMENVKGLLSTTVSDALLFERMCRDLADPGKSIGVRKGHRYRILPLEDDEDGRLFNETSLKRFVLRAERHGVPQCRHRVILLGVREDLGDLKPRLLPVRSIVPAGRVLAGLPVVRSGIGRQEKAGVYRKVDDALQVWRDTVSAAQERRWIDGNRTIAGREDIRDLIVRTIRQVQRSTTDRGSEFVPIAAGIDYEPDWYLDHRIGGVCNHATRTHLDRDLHRYLFAACFAAVNKRSPVLREFPPDLLPNHRNVHKALNGGLFNDRFRVQVATAPSTTITSHIQKDGHYYIHPDPAQCRSLTVREAARLQTFPDNYVFMGPRTMQYGQVGNAVPPYLAHQIADVVLDLLHRSGVVD